MNKDNLDESKVKSLRLVFKSRPLEYIAGGIVLWVLTGELGKYNIKWLTLLAIVLGIFGLFYFLKGIYLLIKKILRGGRPV